MAVVGHQVKRVFPINRSPDLLGNLAAGSSACDDRLDSCKNRVTWPNLLSGDHLCGSLLLGGFSNGSCCFMLCSKFATPDSSLDHVCCSGLNATVEGTIDDCCELDSCISLDDVNVVEEEDLDCI
jgi:hypothetical protein